MRVRVLSIKNPWASLILGGQKHIELRTWQTRYRGPFYIHVTRQGRNSPPMVEVKELQMLPVGHICGRAILQYVKRYNSVVELKQDKLLWK